MFDFVFIVTADDIRRMPPDRFRKMIRSLLILYGIALVGVVLACVFCACHTVDYF